MRTARIGIDGMSCRHCVARVEGALRDMQGVALDGVEIGLARVRYEPEVVSREQLTEAIEEAGFDPTSFIEG